MTAQELVAMFSATNDDGHDFFDAAALSSNLNADQVLDLLDNAIENRVMYEQEDNADYFVNALNLLRGDEKFANEVKKLMYAEYCELAAN